MSKLRLFQVICFIVMLIGLFILIGSEHHPTGLFFIGLAGLILGKILRFIYRD